jgi:hypothetical protein
VVCVGIVVVLALVAPGRRTNTAERAAELRAAIVADRLVALAEDRAARELADPARLRIGNSLPAAYVIAGGSWIAAGIHAFVCPEHFGEGVRFGLFFAAVAFVQFVLGGLVLRSARRRWVVISAVVNIETVVLWAFVHSIGLPFGLAEAESTGALDVIATVAELAAVTAAVAAVLRQGSTRRAVSVGG